MIHVIKCHPKPITYKKSNDLSLFLHLFSHILNKNLDLWDPYHDMAPLSNQRRSEQRLATLALPSVFGCFPQPEEACIRDTAEIGGLAKHAEFSSVERGTMGTYGIQPLIFVGTQPWIWGYNDIMGYQSWHLQQPLKQSCRETVFITLLVLNLLLSIFLGCYTNDWIALVKLNDRIFWSSFSCTMLPVGRVD